MPFTANAQQFGLPPRDPFDLNDRYVVQVKAITEKEFDKYQTTVGEKEMKAIWAFEVYKLAGTPVIGADGNVWTIEDISGLKVGPSKPGKPTAKARLHMLAVLGRDPKEALDGGSDIMAEAIGRYAYALFDEKEQADGGRKLVILKLGTIVDQAKVAAAVAGGIGTASLAAAAPEGLPF